MNPANDEPKKSPIKAFLESSLFQIIKGCILVINLAVLALYDPTNVSYNFIEKYGWIKIVTKLKTIDFRTYFHIFENLTFKLG